MEPLIRWMIRCDFPRVLALTQTDLDEAGLIALTQDGATICLVIEDEHQDVAGHIVYEMRPRSYHLRHLEVYPAYQRRGLGRLLLARLLSKVSHECRPRIVAHVPDAALWVHLLLRDGGFRATSVDHRRSTYRFMYRLPVAAECQGA